MKVETTSAYLQKLSSRRKFAGTDLGVCLVIRVALEGMKMGIVMGLGMRMALGVFGCTFKEMIISNHYNV